MIARWRTFGTPACRRLIEDVPFVGCACEDCAHLERLRAAAAAAAGVRLLFCARCGFSHLVSTPQIDRACEACGGRAFSPSRDVIPAWAARLTELDLQFLADNRIRPGDPPRSGKG